MNTKKCSKCGEEKSVEKFSYHATNKDRLNGSCKECMCIRGKAYYQSVKNLVKENKADIYQTLRGRAQDLFNNARFRAKKKNIPFSITLEWIIEQLIIGKCAITGLWFDLVINDNHQCNPLAPSLDQIEPGMGYTLENTQVVCWFYNHAKSTYTHEVVIEMCRAILKAEE